MRAFARMFGLPLNWAIYGELASAVRTGLPAVAAVRPDGFWAYLAQHPEEGRVFNAAMVDKARGTIGDIGGGGGHLLRAVLDTAPGTTCWCCSATDSTRVRNVQAAARHGHTTRALRA